MFYRFTASGARISVDLEGMYAADSVFLLGGGAALSESKLDLLRENGVVTLGMNNVPCVFRPNLWVAADKPQCFSPHIHASPEITKFTMISRRDLEVPGTGKKVRQFPNFFFFGTSESFNFANFLDSHRDLVWWRSVFPIAIQLAYRLGFRRIFMVGCGFRMGKEPGRQYAWETRLNEDQVNYSQGTYNKDVSRLKSLLPTFARKGLELVSCTPDSAAHDVGVEYMKLEDAVELVTSSRPAMADTTKLLHSSQLKGT